MINPDDSTKRDARQWRLWAAIGAAIGASVCCLVPLALVSVGIGGAWVSSLTAFEPLRPWFIALAVGLLAYAGYHEYKTSTAIDCACESGLATGTRRGLMLIAAVGILGLIAAPYLIANQVMGSGVSSANAAPAATMGEDMRTVVLEIDRMTCASCTVSIDMALKRLDGVAAAVITFDPPHATIRYDPAKLTVAALIQTVGNTGYPARVYTGKPL